MKIKNWPLLLGFIIFCEGVGLIGSVFTFSSIPVWYQALQKPSFSPPNYLFGPVWTFLYAMMGTSFYLIWISKSKLRQNAINLFLVQLGLNALWSFLFFGLRNPALALAEIIILWIFIFLTIRSFWKISKISSYLLWPYLAWVSFATILNLSIWMLNK